MTWFREFESRYPVVTRQEAAVGKSSDCIAREELEAVREMGESERRVGIILL